jgi:hypothetical protein
MGRHRARTMHGLPGKPHFPRAFLGPARRKFVTHSTATRPILEISERMQCVNQQRTPATSSDVIAARPPGRAYFLERIQ